MTEMSNLEKEPSLGDSSGSDGSLAKDLSHQAEMNFASQGILPFENENDLERSRMVEIEKGQTENVIEQEDTLENCDLAKEAEIAPKYIENAMMSDLMEEDCDSNEALMLCEYCHGPITKMKKFGKSGQQFCSKQCAESQTRNEDLIDDDGNDDDEAQIDTSTHEMTDVQDSDQVESSVSQKSNVEVEKSVEDSEAANFPPGFDWDEYRTMLKEKAAPKNCFGRLPKEVKGLIPGMKLEALDKNNPCNYCVATVIDVVGRRVRIRYDGFGNDDSQDFWCNFQADELYPIGWCAENSFPLQPPAGITSTLEDWKIFLTKTLTGALATPMDLFRENEFRLQTKVHSFQAGMRVECIHPKKPSIICPARVTKSLGPYVYQITTEPLPHLPAHMFYGNSESNGIFNFGWTMKNGIDLALPAYLDGSGLTKDQYVAACRARSAPPVGLHRRFKNGFKLGQKLEAVDLEEPSVIRVAKVFNVIGRILHLLFDGRRKFQYVDCESEDIFPIGWCMKTGHPLSTPYGMDPCTVLHSKSLRKAARSSNLQQVISSLSAKLLTNHIKPDTKKKKDLRRFDVYGKSSDRSRRPRATTLSDHCDFYCYNRVIPPSSCEHCFVARDNCELELETDSESESMHNRHKEKSRNYGYCTPCYCSSNRSSEQSRHKRQPFCLDRTHRNEGHPFCSDLAHRSETTADRGDTTEESVDDNIVRESPCCIRNTLKLPTHRSLKRRLENSNTEDELSNVMQAVNKVKHDLANAVEIINNNMLQLTRKLDLIDEKLSKRNVINPSINQPSQSNNSKKAKRVARSIQVNLNAANTVHKTRTKSSLQRKFSTFKRNQVRRHSEFNKTPSSSGSSQGVIPAIVSTYPIVSSSHISSDTKFDRPTMVPNFNSFQVMPNTKALPVNETFPVPKRPDLNTGSGFKNPVSSFGHEIKTVESNHTVENPCIGNKTHEQQEYQQQHSFSPDKRPIASVDPVIESSFSLRSMHGPPAPNTNTNASTISNPSKSPDSIAPMPDGFELTGTEALNPVIEVPTGERLYIDAILQELPDDKSDAIKFMASKGTISRYEFSLKLLDLFFTEEEQCNDAASGGGVLRNLDYVRVHKIKVYPTVEDQSVETEQVTDDNGNRAMVLPSFHTVLGKNVPGAKEELQKMLKAKVDGVIQPTAAEKLPQDSKDATEKKTEDAEKQEESHCVYFNKSCLIGPYLDPEKVASMPDQTAFAKPPAAVRFALEHVINVAIDPIETMDAIQDGFCPKLFSKGKRKILKKSISLFTIATGGCIPTRVVDLRGDRGLFRFDTKLRAGRFLKRLCKKLKSCEYFLSFDPAKDPCPLQCQISGTTSLESFVTMRGMIAKSEPKKDPLDELRRKRGRPRKDDFEPQKHDNNQPQRDYNHSPDGWTANVKTTVATPVRVLNPTSYHGRPLVPIAPSSKIAQSPVSIMPAGSQIQRVRPPPPYEINGRASFVQPVPITTVVTTATQARMVAPVNLRMISPSGPANVVSGQDPSTPTFAAQSLATVLVVTKPHTTGQPVSGLLSFRGNVPNHGLQLPLSPSSRKPQVASNIARMKSPGTIKIHGPMIDQLPGVMNPMSQKHKVVYSPSTKLDSPVKHQHKIKPAIHVPGGQNEKEYNRYRDSHHYEQGATNQVHQFVEIKNKADIKIEPQEQYQITRTSPNNHNHSHVVPTIHIHHPASSSFHSVPTDDLQMRPNSVEILTHIPDRAINDNSGRAVSTLTSPARSDFPSMRFEVAPHQGVNRHGQSVRTHATGKGHNPGQNQTTQSQLHVSTTAADESQSAISPLHSPPPLRPAPANQHRSIALRSPPNLTPSTVLSHFDFSPVSTNTIISQPGLVYHQQQNNQAIVNNGHAGTTDLTIVSVTNNITPATNTTTVTLAYIPVKTQANDKIVYVPYNQNMKNDAAKQHHHQQQQQQSVIYAKQRKPSHHYPGPHSNATVISQTPRDESPIGPYSGITRKFTVRTLQRDPSSLPSSLTTVRIQGPSVTEIGPVKPRENQTGSYPNSNNSKNRYEIQENMAFPGNQVNRVNKAATSPENLTRRENLPHSRSAGNENNLNNNEEDDLNQHFQDFDEISDYDENVDYEEFYDDNVANFEEGEQAEDRKSIGYFRGGRKRGKRRFFVRRKGSTNHQYKIKYKQALEQAKFMREQRPSFMTTNLQNEIPEDCRRIATNNDMSNQRSSAQRNDELDNRTNSSTNSIKSHDASFHFERINTEGMSNNDATPKNSVVIQSKPEIAFKENRNDNSNLFDSKRDSLLMVDGTSETKNVNSDKRFSPMETTDKHNEFATKKRIEGKGPKRKRKNNSSFENDFFYGQWMVSQDSLQKRKKRNSANSLLSPTQYLSDPFERVKLPQNPESWTQSDVSSFISATECSQYADTLKEQEIDGSALLLLTRESLMEFTGMKLGPALKLCGYVAHLKGRIRMRQNVAVMQS